ncbi:hypothetical protein [Mesorhizobium sp.]|uniref:hypothetical protein n=1 Tax=Mesorhizobium sp. TaxID=1871066 RepID=UPI0025CB77EC|nr:hypothetical protein [Mesorhizobium sp.]
MSRRNPLRSSWAIRRRIIVVTLLWCGGMVTYLAILGRPIQLSETAVNGLLLLMASVIGSYVFGAVWDDKGGLTNIGGNALETEMYQRTIVPPDTPVGPAMPPPPGEQ